MDWTPEAIATIGVGAAAGLLALGSIIQTFLISRREGPLLRVSILPATRLPNGNDMVGVRPSDLGRGGTEAVAVTLLSVGRLPVYVDTLWIVARAPIRKRVWRSLTLQELRQRHGLVREGRGEPMRLPDGDQYLPNSRQPPTRIEATERADYVLRFDEVLAWEQHARERGLPGAVQAVLTLGNGSIVKSRPYTPSKPPQGRLTGLRPLTRPQPPQPRISRIS